MSLLKASKDVCNVIKATPPTGFPDMPMELIDAILRNTRITKKLRLISKTFSYNVTICRQVFSVITVWPRLDCYEVLDMIVHHPILSLCVQIIRVANLPRLKQLTCIEDWAEKQIYINSSNLSDPRALRLWSKYNAWVDAETHFWEDGVIPRLDLQLLENLQAVEMAGAANLQRYSVGGNLFVTRREEGILQPDHGRSWNYGCGYYNNCHFSSFAHGSLSSLKTLNALIVHNLPELMGVSEKFELPELKCLDIDMESFTRWRQPDEDFLTYSVPAPWLLSLKSLTTLKLSQCPLPLNEASAGLCYPDVIQLIKNIEFPNLREVRFKTITTKFRPLHRFLRHTNVKHIKALTILHPALPARQWAHLRRELEETSPPYEYLKLTDAYYYGPQSQYEQDRMYERVFQYAPPDTTGR